VTLARQVAAIETALSPTQLVLRWLDEAHAFGDLTSYVRWLLDQPPTAYPLDRLVRESAQGARAGLRGKRAEVVNPAVRTALRETVFRFELVMRINLTTHELIEREMLLYAVFAGQLALLASEGRRPRRGDPVHDRRLAQCRELTAGRVSEFQAAGEARAIAERRYLDGRSALFPDAVSAWAEQLRMAETLALMADHLAELDGVPPAAPQDPDALAARAAMLVADLVEPARSTALDKLDEGGGALAIAVGWLRPKLEPPPADPEEGSAAEPATR
jgi:hypothetical protein